MDYDKLICQLRDFKVKIDGERLTPLICLDAATSIETLRAENEKLRAELEQVKAERDAAVDELHGKCSVCSHYTPYHNDGPCASCKFEVACFVPEKATDKWEWRGIKED